MSELFYFENSYFPIHTLYYLVYTICYDVLNLVKPHLVPPFVFANLHLPVSGSLSFISISSSQRKQNCSQFDLDLFFHLSCSQPVEGATNKFLNKLIINFEIYRVSFCIFFLKETKRLASSTWLI